MKTYNYNYPTALKQGWQAYQVQTYCTNESHAIINLLNSGLQHIETEPILFNTKETVSFTMKLPDPLLKKIDESKEQLGVKTRSKAIFLLIAKGLAKHQQDLNEGKE